MKKILVIPPHSISPIKMKVRLIEIARNLSLKYEVYLLTWHAVIEGGFFARAWTCVSDLFKRKRLYRQGPLIMAEFPLLHRPLFLVPRFNSFFLNKFIKQEKIDVVLNGSYYMFNIPKERKFKYILDLADLPAEGFANYLDRFIYKQVKLEIEAADTITVVSYGLAKFVSENYNRQTEIVPNGAYIDRVREVDSAGVKDIRARYGLVDKWVIGYIGLIGSWVDVEFLVKVFYQVKKEISNTALLLVGASPFLKTLRKKLSGEDIIITGTVEGDISNYLNCLDIGVLPHKKNLFQDLAFHIKLIEYTAARKIVVSAPLEETRYLNFPNVLLADLNLSAWVEAIKKAKAAKWSYDWDRIVEPYDWNNIINKFCKIIDKEN